MRSDGGKQRRGGSGLSVPRLITSRLALPLQITSGPEPPPKATQAMQYARMRTYLSAHFQREKAFYNLFRVSVLSCSCFLSVSCSRFLYSMYYQSGKVYLSPGESHLFMAHWKISFDFIFLCLETPITGNFGKGSHR